MNDNIVLRTIIPIMLLVGMGLFSRKLRVLRSGDERVFGAYVYYFSLPALFFVNMAETNFVNRETLVFMAAGIVPILVVLSVYIFGYLAFRFSRKTLYLLILSTVFGSLAFFGVPFITFAFPKQGEHLATLSAASISPVIVTISITVLELHRIEETRIGEGVRRVLRRLLRNPLILSIFCGVMLSLIGVKIPSPVSITLHMLGGTTSTVAIFMLGTFLFGRKYSNMAKALKLSVLRIVFLPVVAFLITALFGLPSIERSTLVLMHGMPVAISMIILSERYDFHRETIASLILVSSLGAGLYLNLWLLILGYW